MAAPSHDVVDANLFEVESCGVAITYATSSLAGVPQLSYRDKDRELSLSGEQIRVDDTEIGRLVTVTIETIPDLETLTVTLLVPAVNLPSSAPGAEAAFETIAIFTTHRTSIGGPCLVEGQLKTYKCLEVEGMAKRVLF